MQKANLIRPRTAVYQQRQILISGKIRIPFQTVFEPETVSTLNLVVVGKALDTPGRLSVSLNVGGKVLSRKLIKFGRSFSHARKIIVDLTKNYDSPYLVVEPDRNKSFVIKTGILIAPNPRYTYQLSHEFTTEQDANKASELSDTDLDSSTFYEPSDADNEVSSLISRIEGTSAIVTDLDDVYNIDDGTGIKRSIRNKKIPIPSNWNPRDRFK